MSYYEIKNGDTVLAMVIKANYDKDGITFFTKDEYSQQLAFMHHPKGHVIVPHVHNEVFREILYTKEVIAVRKGKLRCDFYTDDKEYVLSTVIEGGDLLLLINGGHGFTCIEETQFFEIKQGPYIGENDKTRFEAVNENDVRMEGLN